MYKVPTKHKKGIEQELKKFVPLINNLQAKGKKSTEEDARILLNDILSYALGYDKYNELKTEMRERNDRIDYVVKLSEGPNSKKDNKFDFVIEAKAAHMKLSQSHVDQTLSYCLKIGIDFFVLTNAVNWQLYKVKRSKNAPSARLIHEVDFSANNNIESLVDDFYLFSKVSYLNGDWKSVLEVAKATNVEDIVAVLLSNKIIRNISKEIYATSGVKVSDEMVKDIVENQIVKSSVEKVNNKLLRKINVKPKRKKKATSRKESKAKDEESKNVSYIKAPESQSADASVSMEAKSVDKTSKVVG
jgi:hypothetical protein